MRHLIYFWEAALLHNEKCDYGRNYERARHDIGRHAEHIKSVAWQFQLDILHIARSYKSVSHYMLPKELMTLLVDDQEFKWEENAGTSKVKQ